MLGVRKHYDALAQVHAMFVAGLKHANVSGYEREEAKEGMMNYMKGDVGLCGMFGMLGI